jgi:hypothetical protein
MRWFDSESRSVTYNVSAQKEILFFASSKRIMASLAHATTYGTTISHSKNVPEWAEPNSASATIPQNEGVPN